MTIRKKLVIISLSTAAMVAGVGVTGIQALLHIREYLRLLPPTPATLELNNALNLLTMLTPICTALAGGVGLSIGTSICQRLNQLRSAPKAGQYILMRMHDELDDVATLVNDMAAKNHSLIEKQVSQHQLTAARRFADNIIKSMYDIMIVTDTELNIVTMNKAACDLLEYKELELIGKPIELLFRSESVLTGPPIRTMLMHNAARDMEMTYKTRSGRLVYALVSASTMRDEAGQKLAVITVGKDITARKQIEHDLLESKVVAESASRAKSAFVANMSHEIRTPMTAILGYADLLGQTQQSAEQRNNCVQTIRRNGQHLLSIINDILDVSKIEAGKMTVEKIPCSPIQLVTDVASLMRIRAKDKQLAFDVRYIGAIPETITSDPTRVRQVLMNLVGNALKFTQSGGVKLIVSMTEPRGGESAMLRFDVVDTGMGLTIKQQESLFKPFVQADESTTRKFGGTGLGLTISKKLAEMLGGDITVRSVSGNGSTFSLTVQTGDLTKVRMVETRQIEAESHDSAYDNGDGTVQLTGRVLVAEDGPDNRVLASFYLEQAGLEVALVENGKLACEAALAAVRSGTPFDMILMDMQMPEMDGYAATQYLRAHQYTGPIIAFTAHAMGGDREKCLACGCSDFAVKPIDPPAFNATIRKYAREAGQEPDPAPAEVFAVPEIAPAPMHPDDPVKALLAKPKLAKLVEKFVTGLDDRLAAIRKAVDEEDHKQLKVLSHQLKGAAGGFGFPNISRVAADMEHVDEKQIATLAKSVRELADLCIQAKEVTARSNSNGTADERR
ncbi:hypothetical protein BH10PLA1_BH10PLA1_08470 [soil metagenome]